jgi:hypothetical protein
VFRAGNRHQLGPFGFRGFCEGVYDLRRNGLVVEATTVGAASLDRGVQLADRQPAGHLGRQRQAGEEVWPGGLGEALDGRVVAGRGQCHPGVE